MFQIRERFAHLLSLATFFFLFSFCFTDPFIMEIATILQICFVLFLVWFFIIPHRHNGRELVGKGSLLIDVRTPQEFASGHISGAINIPVSDVSNRISEFGDKSKPVVIYCQSGTRSAMAALVLRWNGYTVVDVGSQSRY